MDTDVLLTIAEIAGTFAGLVALASLLRSDVRGSLQLYGILEGSFSAVAFALLPVFFSESGRIGESVLRYCAAIHLVAWTLSSVRGYRFFRAIVASDPDTPISVWLAAAHVVIWIAGYVCLGTLVSPWLPQYSGALYSLATFCPLAIAGVSLWGLLGDLIRRQGGSAA